MKNLLKEHNRLMQSTLSLNNLVNNISNESVSSYLKEISSFFTSKIKSLAELFTTNVKDRLKFKDSDKPNAFIIDLKKELKNLQVFSKVPYSDIRQLKVPTVIGLNTDMYSASKIIIPLLDKIKDNSLDYLDKLDVVTSKLISDKDYRLKVGPEELNSNTIEMITRELDNGIKKAYSVKNVYDMDSFGNLFPNNQTVKTVADMLVNAGNSITLENMKELEARIDSIVEKIDVFIDQVNDKQYEISKTMLKNYSDLLSACSQFITSAVSVVHAYNQLAVITKNIIQVINNKFGNK